MRSIVWWDKLIGVSSLWAAQGQMTAGLASRQRVLVPPTSAVCSRSLSLSLYLHLHLFQLLSDICESSSFVIRRSQQFKITRTLNMSTFRIYDSNLPFKDFDICCTSPQPNLVLPKRYSHNSSAPIWKLKLWKLKFENSSKQKLIFEIHIILSLRTLSGLWTHNSFQSRKKASSIKY